MNKATKIAPSRPLRTRSDQTFAPTPDTRATDLTTDEQEWLGREVTRQDVREVMRQRHGVCG